VVDDPLYSVASVLSLDTVNNQPLLPFEDWFLGKELFGVVCKLCEDACDVGAVVSVCLLSTDFVSPSTASALPLLLL